MLQEHNVVIKDPLKVELRFASCYPNLYRSAMSSLGFHIVYDYLNSLDHVYCERVVYPYVRSIETGSRLNDFDVLGFSLQYEEDYLNVLEMLRDAGIPLLKEDRGAEHPLIVAGGPCASSNPLPMTPYIDLFLVGDGEAIFPSFLDTLGDVNHPQDNLERFLEVEGVYVPDHPVKINLIRKMDDAWQPIYQVVAETDNPQLTPAFGNSFLLEVSRGCARGCRFCMAGCLYRPRRELSLGRLLETAELCRDATKMDKVALIGGAVCDHSHFVDLCLGLEDLGLQIALPSLRVESVQDDLLQILKSSGLKTITLAPESTWRLRKVVNKPITDDDVSNAVKLSFDNGLNVKLYYLVGLPTEEEGDLMDVISKIRGLYSLSPRPSSLRVSVNPFIPKPHTPFQWVEYDYKDVRRKLGYLQKKLGSKYFKTASARNGLIQYVLSMSGPDLGSLLEKSIHKKVSFNEWQKLKPIPAIGSLLPWKNIDVGLNDEILLDEYHKAMRGEITPWCETFGCYECGSCTRKVLKHADNI